LVLKISYTWRST